MKNKNQLKVWVLSDGKPGHLNQSLGVAEMLSNDVEVISLKKRKLGGFLSLVSPTLKVTSLPKAPWPDVVVATGNLTSSVSRYIKHQSPSTFAVQMMAPLNRFGLKCVNDPSFDLIVAPVHEDLESTERVLVTKGAPNRITSTSLKEAHLKWAKTFNDLPQPRLAVLVGGTSKRYSFTMNEAEKLVSSLKEYQQKGYSLMVTTSRRTGEEQSLYIERELQGKNTYIYKGEGENPYLGFLACADEICVTCDSVSMVSEACSTGKVVYVYGLDENMQKVGMGKFNLFYKALASGLYIYRVGDMNAVPPKTPLRETEKVVRMIQSKLFR